MPGSDGDFISVGSATYIQEMIAKSNEQVFFVKTLLANRDMRRISVIYNFKTQKHSVLEHSVFYGRISSQEDSRFKLPDVDVLYTGERGAPIYLAQRNAHITVEERQGPPTPLDSIIDLRKKTLRDYHNAVFYDLATNQATREFITFTHFSPVSLLNNRLVLGYENFFFRDISRYTFSNTKNQSTLPTVLPADASEHIDINQLVKLSETSVIALDTKKGDLYKVTVQAKGDEITFSQKWQPIVEEKKEDDYAGLAVFDDMREESESVLKDAVLCKLIMKN
ncbi:MAG: hypothetical protein ABI597_11240 [Gammaproteobacteria bacterium]